jgi:hydrogenase maturation protease
VTRKVLVIGLGNPDRGDDAVGAAIVRSLPGRLPQGATIRERAGDMLALLDDWAGYDAVICIDAAAPAGAPGRIHRLDLATDRLDPELAFASSHAYGLAEAVALARQLGLAPRALIVYAIEGACFDAGAPLSAPVAASLRATAGRVADEAKRLVHDEEPAHA